VGRLDRFDLAIPLASRVGADVLVVSQRLVQVVDGWEALRSLGRLGSSPPEIWIIADDGRQRLPRWSESAAKIIDSGTRLTTSLSAVHTQAKDPPKGRHIVVLGSKGGVGKTFVSANLAAALALRGTSTAALDLDFEAGDLALRLGITPQLDPLGISDPGPEDLNRWASRTPSLDLLVWAAPARPELASAVTEEAVTRFIELAAARARYLVVDTPGDCDCALSYAALERSAQAILVTTVTPGAIRQARVMVELLKRLNYPVRERLRVVLNRVRRRSPFTVHDACEVIGLDPAAIIPDAPQLAENEAYLGRPTVIASPRARVSRLLASLAPMDESSGGSGRRLPVRRMWSLPMPWRRDAREAGRPLRWS